ncbi:hypothetical protein LBMAG56_40580 [Verrucomicrobiota bacterium]|nr:hypothetical protein LBMAG56_40580 [Verrucomicrobiota bacterium]
MKRFCWFRLLGLVVCLLGTEAARGQSPPSIFSQPQNRVGTVGSSTFLSVFATGSFPLFYQWQKYGAPIPNANSSSLSLFGLSTNDCGFYSVVVYSPYGSVTSQVAQVTVGLPDPGTLASFNSTVTSGTYLFRVFGSSFGSIWGTDVYTDDSRLATAALHAGAVTLFQDAVVEVTVLPGLNSYVGSTRSGVTSSSFGPHNRSYRVRAYTPPLPGTLFISSQPADVTTTVGAGVSLAVSAQGLAPLTYQWRLNGGAIPRATNSTLSLPNVRQSDAGHYSVEVRDSGGVNSTTSTEALVLVYASGVLNGAVAYYPFNGNAVDALGAGNSGAVVGATPTVNRFGQGNAAYSFNGTNNYITFGKNESVYPNTTLTWSAWFRQSGYSDNPIILWDDDSQTGGERYLALGPLGDTNSMVFNADDPLAGPGGFAAGGLALGSGWNHVVFTADAASQNLYLNGTLVASTNAPLPDHSGRSYLSLGSGQDGSVGYFNGSIDDLRIFNRALSAGEVASLYATEALITPPRVLQPPLDQVAFVGATATFSVSASGSAPLTYLWQKDGQPLSLQITNTLYLTNVTLADVGAYAVGITNTAGGILSSQAMLTVWTPPVSVASFVGRSVDFAVGVGGLTNLGFQWQFNGANVASATNMTLTLPSVDTTNAGNYRVVITNRTGTINLTSPVATLTIVTSSIPPFITGPPLAQTNFVGATVILTVTNNGTPPFGYQWLKNNTAIPGVNTSTLVLTNITTDDAGDYRVQVGNDYGGVMSPIAHLTVRTRLAFLSPPVGASTNRNAPFTLMTVATGRSALGYQWLRDGVPVMDATNATLNFPYLARTNTGLYSLIIRDSLGSLTSAPVQLNVTGIPQRLSPPARVGGGGGFFSLNFGDSDGYPLPPDAVSRFIVQVTTNMLNPTWETLTNGLSVVNGQVVLEDYDSTNHPARFYRVLEP